MLGPSCDFEVWMTETELAPPAALGSFPEVAGEATAEPPTTRILPASGWQMLNLRELWRYRELLYFLVWRDVKVRYKQTVLGAAWAILQPLMTMAVFAIFLGRLAHM